MTIKRSFAAAFAVGLLAVAWVAAGFLLSGSWLALAMTLAIGAGFLVGARELQQYRVATAGLADAVAQPPQPTGTLGEWLERVPAGLRSAVRQRVEGERGALPGPALTPYLVGLLVMLGMLGTFLGLVVTFKGAVFALEASTDLQAVRTALAEPIKGLGLSFGASVAGVAASAMLGLMSAVCRRERLDVARQLDARIAADLRPFSLVHQRQETFRALQAQAGALPAVASRLDALMDRIEQRSQQLDEALLERQSQLQKEVTQAYASLAHTVGGALKDSLLAATRAAGDSIQPVVARAMGQVEQDTKGLYERLAASAQAQVDTLSQRFAEQLAQVQEQMARDHAGQAERHQRGLDAWTAALHGMAADLQAQWQRATQETTTQANRALEDITLLLARSEELVRSRVESEARWAQEQGQHIAQVASAARVMEQAGSQFGQVLQAQAGEAAEAAAHVGASAVELASLAEAFSHSVQGFQAGNDKLVESLQRIEASINRSTARSDEQLAYYVAQAREVIDLSIASQQGLVDQMRQLQGRPAKAAAEPVVLAGGNA